MNGLMKRVTDECARGIIKHTFIGRYVRYVGLKSIKKELILARRHVKAIKKSRRIYQRHDSSGDGRGTSKNKIPSHVQTLS